MRSAASRAALLCIAGAAILPFAWSAGALAQYPVRPVRIIVPTSAGSGADFATRLLSQTLSERLGQQVVVENRAGATTVIGTELVAKAPPDGYTLGMVPPAFAINPAIFHKLPYDALRDFVPITHVTNSPLLFVVHPSLPAKSVKEVIALARTRPGAIAFASSGTGSITHMTTELFLLMTGTRMLHVPYKGPAPGVIDLVGGRVSLMTTGIVLTKPHVTAGRLRALAVTGSARSAHMPELPTVAEAGVPGYLSFAWNGLVARTGTPQEVVARLYREVTAILRLPEARERLFKEDAEVVASTPEAFGEHIRAEAAKWAKVVTSAGIKPE